MKTTLRILLFFALAAPIHAQQLGLISNQVQHIRSLDAEIPTGRDFWFMEMSNQWGVNVGGKYMRLYISAPENTTAYVQTQGATYPISIQANTVNSFLVPPFCETESSGEIEDNTIHVWSNDGDLVVYNVSYNGYSGEEEYILPTIGWGEDYVVAAASSLFEANEKFQEDFPSTLGIVTSEDNTVITITPTCDCRMCSSGNSAGDANSTIVMFPQGVPFTETLNRGQNMQLMPVKATGPTGFDLSGTVIHSNQPIGVFGGASLSNIPSISQYANTVLEMIPAVRTWGKTYYSTNFVQADTLPATHDSALYLFAASTNNQTIFTSECSSGNLSQFTIPTQFGIHSQEFAHSQKFWSNAPFLCVEYSNSSEYPDGKLGTGDPSEVALRPRENYGKSTLFQTGSQGANFVNLTVNLKDARATLLDGNHIDTGTALCLDSNWEMFMLDSIRAGSHLITGDDSGVGIYGYEYEQYVTFSWSASQFEETFSSSDTEAPLVITGSECLAGFVHLSDSGIIAGDTQSGIAEIRIDSNSNMTYVADNPAFIEGSDEDTTGYGVYVTDPSKPGFLRVDIFDAAGNETIVTSTYAPPNTSIVPPIQILGIWHAGIPANIAYDTIYNRGTVPFTISILDLKYGNVGFSIHDSIGGPVDMSPIPPGGHRLVEIQFEAIEPTIAFDSILFGNECDVQSVAVYGSGGANGFIVTNQSWPGEFLPVPPGGYEKTVEIYNLSPEAIVIDTGWWADVHFKKDPSAPPFGFSIPAYPGSIQYPIDFFPDANTVVTPDITIGNWTSPQVLTNGSSGPEVIVKDSLYGSAFVPSELFGNDTTVFIYCAPPNDTISVPLTLMSDGFASSPIKRIVQSDSTDFLPLIGVLSIGTDWNPQDSGVTIPAGQSATIWVTYPVPSDGDTVLYDSIFAYDYAGNLIGGRPIIVEMLVTYTAYNVPSTVDFGSVTHDSKPDTVNFFIQNTKSSPLYIDTVRLAPGNPYDSAFQITTQPALPVTLDTNGELQVSVRFYPSVSDDPVQQIPIDIVSNACNDLMPLVTAEIANSSVSQTPSIPATSVIVEGNVLDVFVPTAFVAPVSFQLVDVLGVEVLRASIATGTSTLDLHALPTGVYFWRITEGGIAQNGKILLGE